MSAKEIIEKLRLTFNELVTPVAVANPIQLMDATLKDGTAVQTEKFAYNYFRTYSILRF